MLVHCLSCNVKKHIATGTAKKIAPTGLSCVNCVRSDQESNVVSPVGITKQEVDKFDYNFVFKWPTDTCVVVGRW